MATTSKSERIQTLKLLLMRYPAGLKIEDIIKITGFSYLNVNRDLADMGAKNINFGYYTYEPDDKEIEFAKAIVRFTQKNKTE